MPTFTRSRRDAPGLSHGEESRAVRRQIPFHQCAPLDNIVKIWYICSMKAALTAKLKLKTTPEQFQALRQTQLAYRDALNYVSRYAYEHGKMSNKVRLQDGTY